MTTNALGQPIGHPVPGWTPPPRPPRAPLTGRYCRLEPLEPDRHAADLHSANQADAEERMGTDLAHGAYPTPGDEPAWRLRT